MNDAQKHLCTLLAELDALFEARGIRYVTTNYLTFECLVKGGYEPYVIDAALLIARDDLQHLLDEGGSLLAANREFVAYHDDEGNLTHVRYSDPSTTMYDVLSADARQTGIGVYLNAVWKEADGFAFRTASKESGHRQDNDPLDSPGRAVFEHLRLPLPNKPEQLMADIAGANWRKKFTPLPRRIAYGTIVDTELPCETFLAETKEAGCYDISLAKRAAAWHTWLDTDYAATVAPRRALTPGYECVTQRFRYCAMLMPHKEALLGNWTSGKRNLVRKALSQYTNSLKSFYDMGLTLYFDRELFDLAVTILREAKWAHADELEGLIPQRHKDELLAELLMPYLEA